MTLKIQPDAALLLELFYEPREKYKTSSLIVKPDVLRDIKLGQ